MFESLACCPTEKGTLEGLIYKISNRFYSKEVEANGEDKQDRDNRNTNEERNLGWTKLMRLKLLKSVLLGVKEKKAF